MPGRFLEFCSACQRQMGRNIYQIFADVIYDWFLAHLEKRRERGIINLPPKGKKGRSENERAGKSQSARKKRDGAPLNYNPMRCCDAPSSGGKNGEGHYEIVLRLRTRPIQT